MSIDHPSSRRRTARLALALACIAGLGATLGPGLVAGSAACCDDPIPLVSRTYGPALAIDVEGGLAAIAISSQVALVDVTAPTVPRVVGRASALPDAVVGLDLAGERVYVAAGALGIRIIDIAQPENPRDVGAFDTRGLANGIAVDADGALAYVADGPAGLRILDVADPAAIREVGALDTPGEAVAIAVGRGHAFVADFEGGLRVIDVADPTRPVEVEVLSDKALRAWDVALRGTSLVVSMQPDKLWHVDVSSPGTSRLQATSTLSRGEVAGDVTLTPRALVHAGFGLQFQEPTTGVVLANYDAVFDYTAVASESDMVYTVSDEGGFYAIDAALPNDPQMRGGLALVDDIEHVVIDGATAYVAARTRLQRLDLRERPMPREVATIALPAEAHALAIAGRHLVVAAGSTVYADNKPKQLLVYDIGGAGAPVLVASRDFIETPLDVVVDGNTAYVAFGAWYQPGGDVRYRGGLRVFDLSNPAAPAEVGAALDDDRWAELALVGRRLFALGELGDRSQALNGSQFLRAVDVVDPERPAIIGDVDASLIGDLRAIAGGVDRLYAGTFTMGDASSSRVLALDVSNPRFPNVVATQPATGIIDALKVDGSHLFTAANRVDPRAPVRHGDRSYLNVARLTAYDVARPDKLEPIAAADVSLHDASAIDLGVGGGFAGIGAGRRGLWVFDVGSDGSETGITPTAEPTATPTAEPTAIPPTETPTPAPSATSTTEPPTATPTPTPRSWHVHLPVAYRVRDEEITP